MKNLNVFSVLLFVLLMPSLAKSQHFQTVWESPFSPMNVYLTSATLNELNLQAGDEIGLFDVFEGESYCVGAIELSEPIQPGEYVQIICSMDDNSTVNGKNGFQSGNPFIFKYWANNVEFEDVEFSFPFPGYDESFVALGTALVDLSLTAEFQSQTLNLSPGWNAMSSYLNPLNPVMEDLLGEISNELIIVQNPDGSYYPSGNLNDLETWNYESGYFIKLTDSVALNIIGNELANPEIMLETGWNLIPVLSDTSISIVEMFDENIDKVVLIKEAAGLNLFWPEKEISTLEKLTPGKSYLINVSESFTVSFTGNPVFECGDLLVDERDGQEYATVQIGEQCWMAENMNIGVRIESSEDMADNGTFEKYCYDNSESNCDIYGGLYQWDEAMQYTTIEGTQGICMSGWHLPSLTDMSNLSYYMMYEHPEYLCNSNIFAYGKALASTTTDWITHAGTCAVGNNIATNNTTGFTGLPGGWSSPYGWFATLGAGCNFWASWQSGFGEGGGHKLYYSSSSLSNVSMPKNYGRSVRCIKD